MRLLNQLVQGLPLTPLTGDDGEWLDVTTEDAPAGEKLFQNVRCSRVFKHTTEAGVDCFDVEGRVFVRPNGEAFTNGESRVKVAFPYMPKTEFFKVEDEPEEAPKAE
jgi:hypothetical protein